jgi:hypothetical protein
VLTLLVDIFLFLICGNILKWLLHKPVGNTDFDLKVCHYSDKVHFDPNLLMDLWCLWSVVGSPNMTSKELNWHSDIVQLLNCLPSNYNQSMVDMSAIKTGKKHNV